jgi:hypothetical protein
LDAGHVDMLFWAGITFSVLIIIVIFNLFVKISDKAKEIGDLS